MAPHWNPEHIFNLLGLQLSLDDSMAAVRQWLKQDATARSFKQVLRVAGEAATVEEGRAEIAHWLASQELAGAPPECAKLWKWLEPILKENAGEAAPPSSPFGDVGFAVGTPRNKTSLSFMPPPSSAEKFLSLQAKDTSEDDMPAPVREQAQAFQWDVDAEQINAWEGLLSSPEEASQPKAPSWTEGPVLDLVDEVADLKAPPSGGLASEEVAPLVPQSSPNEDDFSPSSKPTPAPAPGLFPPSGPLGPASSSAMPPSSSPPSGMLEGAASFEDLTAVPVVRKETPPPSSRPLDIGGEAFSPRNKPQVTQALPVVGPVTLDLLDSSDALDGSANPAEALSSEPGQVSHTADLGALSSLNDDAPHKVTSMAVDDASSAPPSSAIPAMPDTNANDEIGSPEADTAPTSVVQVATETTAKEDVTSFPPAASTSSKLDTNFEQDAAFDVAFDMGLDGWDELAFGESREVESAPSAPSSASQEGEAGGFSLFVEELELEEGSPSDEAWPGSFSSPQALEEEPLTSVEPASSLDEPFAQSAGGSLFGGGGLFADDSGEQEASVVPLLDLVDEENDAPSSLLALSSDDGDEVDVIGIRERIQAELQAEEQAVIAQTDAARLQQSNKEQIEAPSLELEVVVGVSMSDPVEDSALPPPKPLLPLPQRTGLSAPLMLNKQANGLQEPSSQSRATYIKGPKSSSKLHPDQVVEPPRQILVPTGKLRMADKGTLELSEELLASFEDKSAPASRLFTKVAWILFGLVILAVIGVGLFFYLR